MRLTKKILSGVLAITMVAVSLFVSPATKSEASGFDDLNQNEIVAAMGAGWNLGNQLESVSDTIPCETAWGNPEVTESLIQAVKNAGFSSIRIPVSYMGYIDDSNSYTVNSSWLDRVQEVVDMCIDNGLYAIINMHGDGYTSLDGGWLLCGSSDQTTIKEKYEAVWKQIATRFKDYDEHLIFESMNEEFDGTYGTPSSTAYDNINDYNQIFVDTVRQTGGNNDKRWLLIPGWNTNIEYTAGDYGFELPSDDYLSSDIASGEKRIMISVHYYDPWGFCGEESTTATQWGSTATDSSKVDSWGQESYMQSNFNLLYTTFVENGYPVVIGEYGSIDKSAYDSANTACRADFAKKVCTYASQYGLIPVVWDNGYTGTYGFGLFDRSTYEVTQQSIIDAIMSVYASSDSDSSAGSSSDTTDTVIFSGSANESYSTSDASWLMDADDSDVITLQYTCSDSDHAYWGILGWGASVDGSWVNGDTYAAASTATDTVTVTFTAAELKSSLGISSSSTVGYLALSAYNGGQIVSLSIASSSDSSTEESSATTITLNADDMTWGNHTSDFTVGDFTIGSSSTKNTYVETASTTVNGTTYSQRLKMNGGADSTGRYIKFTTTGAGTVSVDIASTSTSASRTIRLSSGSVGGTTIADQTVTEAATLTYDIPSAGTYYIYSKSCGVYVYGMTVTY
ncbi:MAG: cellulase family glycosylhydrolase [Clostridiaceae bacterium]|nr:cellulase family glycosylhydrolase [Clostridiaceae bacterium]